MLARRILRVAAAAIARSHPLRRVPGWSSRDALEAPADAYRGLRRRLWETLSGEPLQVGWYHGLRVELTLGNDLSHCLYVGGEIDPNEFAVLADLLRPGMMVIDGGANEGLYSLFCRQLVGPQGMVLAVEPSERERTRLVRNATLNGFHDICISGAALSDHDAAGALRVAEAAHAGHNTLGNFAAPWVRHDREEKVVLCRLDTLAERHGLQHVDLIKLDIEGAELAALRGAEAILARHRPVLLVEVMEEALALQGASAAALLSFLRSKSYRILEFSAATGRPEPFAGDEPCSVNVLALPAERAFALVEPAAAGSQSA